MATPLTLPPRHPTTVYASNLTNNGLANNQYSIQGLTQGVQHAVADNYAISSVSLNNDSNNNDNNNDNNNNNDKPKGGRSRSGSLDLFNAVINEVPHLTSPPAPSLSSSSPPLKKPRRPRSNSAPSSFPQTKKSLLLTSPFPHTLLSSVYSKNGYVGCYSPSERSEILRRFKEKRCKRVWTKKIRYGCRKSLADRRVRVKGRFVKVRDER
mmetsp:Transcript_13266/g.24383  ORF Transcript_13266/g.24383 Transcript_13266/m.24383 type:complete len:210 (-) Transcript_13266:602-1231(-)|eukprot:CAMPEP_0182519710 /NCGR_PEP_ID=MMETSP1321-20130603/45237_1 /TAXON_ID=91990 /ORGANISM="Bolidomonas sp., Strain RCC1657" /LENGTH=209 /DNA_ID=CAMNT_0024727695 /DNA_START=231 /DNA_END=860 /DNA_ORIENTATION=+